MRKDSYKKNIIKLSNTCNSIQELCVKMVYSGKKAHKISLGDLIREFLSNPIVKDSGLSWEEIKNRH